jgi:hypothetical protein
VIRRCKGCSWYVRRKRKSVSVIHQVAFLWSLAGVQYVIVQWTIDLDPYFLLPTGRRQAQGTAFAFLLCYTLSCRYAYHRLDLASRSRVITARDILSWWILCFQLLTSRVFIILASHTIQGFSLASESERENIPSSAWFGKKAWRICQNGIIFCGLIVQRVEDTSQNSDGAGENSNS